MFIFTVNKINGEIIYSLDMGWWGFGLVIFALICLSNIGSGDTTNNVGTGPTWGKGDEE